MLPGGDTGRSVIGRTDIDGIGTAGLEKQYDNVLAGTAGTESLEVAPGGRSIAGSEQVVEAPIPGADIVLTLDRSVQYAAEQALLTRVGELGARGGQAIVMDTKTGEVLAMASVRINSDSGVYEITSGNYSAVDAYEPGSVGKVITISGALNDGTVTPDTVFTVPWQKVYTNNGDRLHDSHQHGTDPMTVERHPHRVLEHRHDHGVRDAARTWRHQLRAAGPLHAPVRARPAHGAQLPGREPGHPEALAGVGGHREVHRRLRSGRRQQPDPAHLRRQRDRQRRHLRGAEAGPLDGRRCRRGA